MTLTFNSDTYTNLLVKYQPKVIKTEVENERAISLAEELDCRSHRTPEEESLLELLLLLIEKFEEEHYPIPQSSGRSILLHLIEENDLNSDDLAGILGNRINVTDIIHAYWHRGQYARGLLTVTKAMLINPPWKSANGKLMLRKTIEIVSQPLKKIWR